MKARFVLLGTAAAGVAMYLWGSISHVLLPWHGWTMRVLGEGKPILDGVRIAAPENGVYLVREGIFLAVNLLPGLPDQTQSIGTNLALQFVTALAVAFLLALALLGIRCPTVLSRAGFTAMMGVAAGVAVLVPHWNWYGFSAAYTLVNIIDLGLSWFIGGLTLAALARRMLPAS